MAKNTAVWGIDIGQCALKALRCRTDPDDTTRIAPDAFDYIEYPKILTQPEADPAQMVKDAIETFLSRNEVKGDRVAISVSGQSGLARFIKLPPVESKKIPDIVKYEAKQQIPFALEDVVWDYQQMAGGSEDEGFSLETEVGLFAMKRDQVYRALKPFDDAGIAVDFIQLTPLAIFNYISFDQFHELPPPEDYDPDDPPESTVVISLGTDTTDLVVTNGYRVWQRSIPLGGSHFTKALTKELRLTFSKAEHLKRNATEAEDPKAVFQAMRPVFNDLLTEVQRSIGYFSSLDRGAKIGQIVSLGNAMKLPGLQRFLSDSLEHKVVPIESFRGLSGSTVTEAPQFKENQLSFGVCYGLCLQGLGLSKIGTNLLPQEIVTKRLIKQKKPWAVAAAAALLVGCTVNYFSHYSAWSSADVTRDEYVDAFRQAKTVTSKSAQFVSAHSTAKGQFENIQQLGRNLIGNAEGRIRWLELLKAIDVSLPEDDPENVPEKIGERNQLHIEAMDCEKFEDLSTWFAGAVKEKYEQDKQSAYRRSAEQQKVVTPEEAAAEEVAAAALAEAGGGEVPPATPPADGAPATAATPATADAPATADDPATPTPDAPETPAAEAAPANPSQTGNPNGGDEPTEGEDAGPQGPGWVIEMRGYHYHNEDLDDAGAKFLGTRFLQVLEKGTVPLPDGPNGEIIEVPIKDLGIGYPVLVYESKYQREQILDEREEPEPEDDAKDGDDKKTADPRMADMMMMGRGRQQKTIEVLRFDFTIQFSWQHVSRSERLQPGAENAAALAGPGADGTEVADAR